MAKQARKKDQHVILNNGIMQFELTIPAEGLLVRLRRDGGDGRTLAASFPEGQSGPALQMITWALQTAFQVDPILDEDHPFRAYNPGAVCGNTSPRQAVSSRSESGKAIT